MSDYYFSSIKNSLDSIEKERKSLLEKIEQLKNEKIGKIIEIEKYPQFTFSAFEKSEPEVYRKKLEEIYEQCKKIKEKNELAIKNNTEVLNKSIDYMKSLGLKATEYVYKSSRSYKKVEKAAGWWMSLRSQIPINQTPWSEIEHNYNFGISEINKLISVRQQQIREEQEAQQRINQEREELQKFEQFLIENNLPLDTKKDDVFNLLLKKKEEEKENQKNNVNVDNRKRIKNIE